MPLHHRLAQLLVHFFHGSLLALGFVTLQFLAFVTCFLGSSFGAMAFAAGIHLLWNFELPPFVICLVQGLLLIRCTEIYAWYEEIIIGGLITRGIRRYPIFLGLFPVLATMTLNLYGIYVVYAEFTRFHQYADQNPDAFLDKIPTEGNGRILLQKTLILLSANRGIDICHFITAFSYLIFTTAAVIHTELQEQLKTLTVTTMVEQEFVTVMKTFFLLIQIGLTLGYAVPLFYSYIVFNYMSPNVMDKGTSFFYLAILAATFGFLGSYLESKNPFPQVKGRAPLFAFERNVQARILLLKYGLLPFLYFSFFDHRPVETATVTKSGPEASSLQIDPHFLLFSIIFALLILHTLKILSMSLFIPRILERRRIRRFELQQRQLDAAEAQNLERAEEGQGNEVVEQFENGDEIDPTFLQDQIGNLGDSANNNPTSCNDDEESMGTETWDKSTSPMSAPEVDRLGIDMVQDDSVEMEHKGLSLKDPSKQCHCSDALPAILIPSIPH